MRNKVTVLALALSLSVVAMFVPSNVGAYSQTAIPQATPETPLSEDELSTLLDSLKEGLVELVGDEDKATAIAEKWDAREDLDGKTRKQVLGLLFGDVRSVVSETDVQNKLWAAWNSAPKQKAETPIGKPRDGLNEYINSIEYDANRLLSVQATGDQPMYEKVFGQQQQRVPGSGKVTQCTRATRSLSANFDDIMILQPTRGTIFPGSLIIADRSLKDGGPRAIPSLARAPINLRVDLPGATNDGGFSVEQPTEANVKTALNGAVNGWNNSGNYREGHTDTNRSTSKIAVSYSRDQTAIGLGFDSNWVQGPLSGLLNSNSNLENTVATLLVKQVFYTVSVDAPESPAGFFAEGVTAEQAQAAFSSTSVPAYVGSVSYGHLMMIRLRTEKPVSAAEATAALKYAAGLATVNSSQKTAYDNILATSEITASTIGAGGIVTTDTISAADIARRIKGGPMVYSKANAGVPVSFTVNFLKDNATARLGATTQYSSQDCLDLPNYWLEIQQHGWYMADYTVTWDEPGAAGKKQEGRYAAGNKMRVIFAGDATNIRMYLRTMSGVLIVDKILQPSELNKAYRTDGTAVHTSFGLVQN